MIRLSTRSRLLGGAMLGVGLAALVPTQASAQCTVSPAASPVTGSVTCDSTTTEEIMTLFSNLNKQGITIIMVTHEQDVAEYAGRRITFKDGQIMSDTRG